MTTQGLPKLGVAALLALVGLLGVPGEADAKTVGRLLEESKGFPDRVERLRTQYLKPAILETRFTLETRFNDARVAYMLEDYDRASLLFADIVRSPDFAQFESARRALYLLGDSLYQRRNFLAAKKYFQRIVDRGEGEHYQDAVVRLLEIAAKTGEYAGVQKLYERFDDQRKMGPAVQYMRGKTLYRQGKPGKAIPFFSQATNSEEWAYRARYFKGVCLADQKKYAQAREVFRGLTEQIDPENQQERNVLHLSYLALGRIAYEQRNVEQAINFYQQLPRTSEYFDRALYELTWVLVSRKDYEEASRNADIFLYLANPDPTFIPEVKLLKADLLLRTDDYQRASAAYRDVIDQFEPVKKRMENFLRENVEIETFFRELVEEEFEGENPVYMPQTVRKWIDRGEKMQEARKLVQDTARLQEDVARTRQAIKEMQARIKSGSAVESFPSLAEGMTLGIETEHQLIRLRRDLLRKEYRLLRPVMNSSEKKRWRRMQKELDSFEERYKKIPKTKREVRKRERSIDREFTALKKELDSVDYMLKGQKEQLENVNEYIQENYENGLPEEKQKKVETLREEVRNNIRELQKEEEKLRKRIAVVRQKIGVGDRVTQRERKMGDKYREMLAKRRQFLEQFHSRVGAGKRRKLRKISKARSYLKPADRELQEFFTKMRQIVDEKAAELREKIAREQKLLAQREKRLAEMMTRSKDEAAKAALNNYLRVRNKFDEIVMRGDVGLLDVVWQKKQDKTQQLNQLRQNRRQELKQLQQAFQEVR